ncbi:hypothetical protein NPIL_400691 [Nephila pilipes]|uniref:Uncharacterized protein n=1 Tax=Nephila pilipes TaxID=299642 RepID=A0A8X6TKS3_NEPPI|nr:hypothetical protein NPIL_400691 [Nephila pilipes]
MSPLPNSIHPGDLEEFTVLWQKERSKPTACRWSSKRTGRKVVEVKENPTCYTAVLPARLSVTSPSPPT